MSLGPEEIAHVRDLFSGLGEITTRRMMGGVCLYHHGTIFAMKHSDGRIMLKGAGAFPAEIEAAGGARWNYTRKDGHASSMPYWTLPDEAMDDPDLAVDWARRALEAL